MHSEVSDSHLIESLDLLNATNKNGKQNMKSISKEQNNIYLGKEITCHRVITRSLIGNSETKYLDSSGKEFKTLDEFKKHFGVKEVKFVTDIIDKDSGKVVERYEGPICYEGAVKLAAAILSATYKDYTRALQTIMELRKKSHKTKADQKLLSYAIKTKIECELFYKSKRFEIFTLGKAKPAQEVIKDIHKRVGYVEVAC